MMCYGALKSNTDRSRSAVFVLLHLTNQLYLDGLLGIVCCVYFQIQKPMN